MKVLINILAILFFFAIFVNTSTAQSEWLMVNGNPQRTNYVSSENQLQAPLIKEKNITVNGEYILFQDNILYLMNGGSPNYVFAYNTINSDYLWRFEISGSGGSIGFIPVISDDKIFCSGQNGKGLFVLDKKTGEQKWFLPTGNQYSRSPITDRKGHLFINTFSGDLLCLKENNGDIIWSINEIGYITPSYYDNKIFISSHNKLKVLNSKTGETLWQRVHSSGSRGHVLLDETGAYLCVNNTIACYNSDNGAEKWYYQLSDTLYCANYNQGTACLTDSVLCVTLVNKSYTNGRLLTINKFTGEKLWEYVSDYPFIHPPVGANGYIYANKNYQNWLGSFNQMTGELVFEDKSQNYWGLIIANHRLYVLSQSGVSIFKTKTSSIDDNSNNGCLFDVFPNPCYDKIAVNYKLPERGKTSIILYDLAGKQEKILYDKVDYAGEHQRAFADLTRIIHGFS